MTKPKPLSPAQLEALNVLKQEAEACEISPRSTLELEKLRLFAETYGMSTKQLVSLASGKKLTREQIDEAKRLWIAKYPELAHYFKNQTADPEDR